MSAVFQRVGSTASTALPSGGGGMATEVHPHDLRVQVRSQFYANSEVERETIAAVDREVFSRVRGFERALVDVANGFREDAKADLQAATDIAAALRTEVRLPLSDGADPRDLAEKYEDLRRRADDARRSLDRVIRESEWQAERCEDPYSSFCALLSKFPGIRRGIEIHQ